MLFSLKSTTQLLKGPKAKLLKVESKRRMTSAVMETQNEMKMKDQDEIFDVFDKNNNKIGKDLVLFEFNLCDI